MSTALVVTSIHPPNAAMRELAAGCRENGWNFIVAGDSKSPRDFQLEGCDFISLETQRRCGFSLGLLAPEKSYTRKNIGYLAAMQAGAKVIVETDDDNHPLPDFWKIRQLSADCLPIDKDGWVNAYRYFSADFIYPRGLPLPHARDGVPAAGASEICECPIQQHLADNDPDVDAVYRMLFPLPFRFEIAHSPVLLRGGSWCPFNSQNTTFFESAFPLLYLPAGCSFRMTDIWRSFIAQRILKTKNLGILFGAPTVWQERNEHDLQQDFHDELPGYHYNAQIREELNGLTFRSVDSIQVMMEICYEVFIRNGWINKEEEALLNAWFVDINELACLKAKP